MDGEAVLLREARIDRDEGVAVTAEGENVIGVEDRPTSGSGQNLMHVYGVVRADSGDVGLALGALFEDVTDEGSALDVEGGSGL
jgi:hypothetical protein